MLELKLLSLLVGSLGLQATLISGWLWGQQRANEQLLEEEEVLTSYESKDAHLAAEITANGGVRLPKDPRLAGWEFKIVRASRDLFRDPAIFHQVCEEESHAGWVLLEKLDDRRIRFKRPLVLRDMVKSSALSIDPYRSHYGPASNWSTTFMGLAFLVAILLPAYLGYALVSATLSNTRSPVVPTPEPSPSESPMSSSPNLPNPLPTRSPAAPDTTESN